jgi:TRAP-type C4-dicarboxylate transport system permease large subunit
VAAAVVVLLAFAAAFFVALAHEHVTDRISASAPTVKRWGGYLLTLVGVWLITLGVFAEFFARVFPV